MRNVISGSPSILRRPATEKSNVELVNSLRSNLLAARESFAPAINGDTPSHLVHQQFLRSLPYTEWTTREDGYLFVPSVDFQQTGLAEGRSQYDITAKLFFLANSSATERSNYVKEAVNLVLRQLHVPSLDLLIVSFPGISFDKPGDCEDPISGKTTDTGEGEDLDLMVKTWHALEDLIDQGLVQRIGIAEFGAERLQSFLPRIKIRPAVDQINLSDMCLVPKQFIEYAKQHRIDVMNHSDCTNILPSGTLRELLGTGEKGASVMLKPDEHGAGLRGDIKPRWVIKYTAVVHERGVIEDKGYFAMAQIDG